VPTPPDGGEPRLRAPHGRRRARFGGGSCAPPVEPCPRRAWIDLSPACRVLLEVHQNVDDCMTHGARCRERSRMVPLIPDRTATTERAVDCACDSDGEPSHAARQTPAVICLDDEMNVIVLDRIVNDPETTVGGRDQCTPEARENPARAEAADGSRRPERDVHGMGGAVGKTRAMRHAGSASRGQLPAGAAPSATPRLGGRKRELDSVSSHGQT